MTSNHQGRGTDVGTAQLETRRRSVAHKPRVPEPRGSKCPWNSPGSLHLGALLRAYREIAQPTAR